MNFFGFLISLLLNFSFSQSSEIDENASLLNYYQADYQEGVQSPLSVLSLQEKFSKYRFPFPLETVSNFPVERQDQLFSYLEAVRNAELDGLHRPLNDLLLNFPELDIMNILYCANGSDYYGSIIHRLVKLENFSAIKYFVRYKADLNIRDSNDLTVFEIILAEGDVFMRIC